MNLNEWISLNCDRRKFSECDHCVLNHLRSHLIWTEENNLVCSQIQQILMHFKQAMNQGGVLCLTVDGQVQFMTQRAEQLLSQYFSSCASNTLPDSLIHWFKHQISQFTFNANAPSSGSSLHVDQAGQQLIVRLIPNSNKGHYLLLLEEKEPPSFSITALELLELTKREAEVLFWVARDKSNSGIARVLGCCEGTVRKHLENIYKKLSVQTRTGAVMVALERLGLF